MALIIWFLCSLWLRISLIGIFWKQGYAITYSKAAKTRHQECFTQSVRGYHVRRRIDICFPALCFVLVPSNGNYRILGSKARVERVEDRDVNKTLRALYATDGRQSVGEGQERDHLQDFAQLGFIDPPSKGHATFETLGINDPVILRNLVNSGIKYPTSVQSKSIPYLLEKLVTPASLIAKSQRTPNCWNTIIHGDTGSGKTLAFLLPILLQIETELPGIQALIISATRELASQTYRVAQTLLKQHPGLRAGLLIGGANFRRQKELLQRRKPQVVIGTVGRILDLSEKKLQSCDMRNCRYLVLDEFDVLLDNSSRHFFLTDRLLTRYLPSSAQRQTVCVSATRIDKGPRRPFGQLQGDTACGDQRAKLQIINYVGSLLRDKPVKKIILPHGAPLYEYQSVGKTSKTIVPVSMNQNVLHFYIACRSDRSLLPLQQLLAVNPRGKRVIIFCRNPSTCTWLYHHLVGSSRVAHIVQMATESNPDKANNRKAFWNSLTAGVGAHTSLLVIATDSAARGIDIPCLTHVINYDIPQTLDRYIHRSGRVGRAGNPGVVITLVPRDKQFLWKRLVMQMDLKPRHVAVKSGRLYMRSELTSSEKLVGPKTAIIDSLE